MRISSRSIERKSSRALDCKLVLIIAGLIEFFFRDHSDLDIWDYFSTYIGAAFIVCLICTGITYEIGYGFVGGSSFGQASLEVYNSFTGAEQALQDSISQIVEENCKLLSPEQCQLLRTTAKTAQTVQEISDYAEQLRAASEIVK